jgi:hypothetical protein
MAAPAKVNFKLYQGSTFNEVVKWESPTKVFKSITGITKSAPPVVTSIAHNIPVGWRILITDVGGMKEINDAINYVNVTDTSVDALTLGELNAASFSTYTSGGVITYNVPTDLTGYTAKMQIRSKITDTDFLFELTTENAGILLDTTLSTITLFIDAVDTAATPLTTGVYSLEMIKGGIVTTIATGSVTLVPEVTR